MNGGILREVQVKEGDEEPHSHYYEEQEAGDHRDLPSLQYEDVQDRQISIQPANSFAPGAARVNLVCPRPTSGWSNEVLEWWVPDSIDIEGSTMNCLITGAAGFIGSTLSERLLGLGYRVTGIDCFTDYYSTEIKKANIQVALASPSYEFIEGDLLDLDLNKLLAGIDWVFHQAAQPGVRPSWGVHFEVYVRNNILVTQRLLEAAKGSGIRKLVCASSSSVYGDSPELPLVETARPQPISPYGVTKLAAEHLCHLYCVNYSVPTVSLRYFTVYGPRQRPDMAFNKFIRSALKGEEIVVFGDGEQTRDFTYVSDAVEANFLAACAELGRGAESGQAVGRVFNIGGGSRISVNAVLGILQELVGPVSIRHEEDQKGDVRHTMSGTTSAREVLGYSPKVGIREGLALQVEWMCSLP